MAASIKWTGLTFLVLMLVLEALRLFKNKNLRGVIPAAAKLIIIPFVVYFSVFVLHFALLDKPGPGDAYMAPGFQDQNLIKKFTDLNLEMYRSNQRLTATHPYSSQWYAWPFMTRPIFYWISENSRIYLLGNPIIWWASTLAVILLLLKNLKFKILNLKLNTAGILLGGYFLNLLPFIGIKRVMFLY